MKTRAIYQCENCGKEFESKIECLNHEKVCDDRHLKYRENVKSALEMITNEYGSLIKTSAYRTDDEVEFSSGSYSFEIYIELANGNFFTICDGCDENLWQGNYLETETIYNSTKKAIEDRLTTSYEGVLIIDYDDCGWRADMLGEVELSDIVDRLEGRKVRIEVID